jgi:hypothetical protein
MADLGYDINITSTDYLDGNPAHLGNYLAQQMLLFGFQDGANELASYENDYYEPVNPSLIMDDPGNPSIVDPNRWQPLTISNFIDQAGNPSDETPDFLSPEWGNVVPFALSDENQTTYERDGETYHVFKDPGMPPLLDTTLQTGLEDQYKWGFLLVAVWASHLDTNDGVIWDISPATIGNIALEDLPTSFEDYPDFYDFLEGGEISPGHDINPHTGQPYTPQLAYRGDYARVLAEFWADGPDSETPPGHWFVILNYVNDNPLLEKRWRGEGPVLDDLEWDVKSYFTLGGTMHDAAISAWSVKGWYDYVRPVSAIRYMAEKGQSTDENLPNYHPAGMPLIPGLIELVAEGDPLAGDNNENVNEIKLYTWRGPDFIDDPDTDVAGVGWILAKNWWPYQRPTFVTPPFAGYVSGHSTYSRAAAEALTRITGDPFFPGGMGEFEAPKDEFLVFENGPSLDITLQWATYRDASDQCSLSRIWGGIHPPADDIPGRFIGEQVGNSAFEYAEEYILARNPEIVTLMADIENINRTSIGQTITLTATFDRDMDTSIEPTIAFSADLPVSVLTLQNSEWTSATTYTWTYIINDEQVQLINPIARINGAADPMANPQDAFAARPFQLDTQSPTTEDVVSNKIVVADMDVGSATLTIATTFSEPMNTFVLPTLALTTTPATTGLVLNTSESGWTSETEYTAVYNLTDENEAAPSSSFIIENAEDILGNPIMPAELTDFLIVDTKNPIISAATPNTLILNEATIGTGAFRLEIIFDEEMNTALPVAVSFPVEDAEAAGLSYDMDASSWINATTFEAVYDVADLDAELSNIDVAINDARDIYNNELAQFTLADAFRIDTRIPMLANSSISEPLLTDANVSAGNFTIVLTFDEPMAGTFFPAITFPNHPEVANTLQLNEGNSFWASPTTFRFAFDVLDDDIELEGIDFEITDATDQSGNPMEVTGAEDQFAVDTKNPQLLFIAAEPDLVTNEDVGPAGFTVVAIFDQELDPMEIPQAVFPSEQPQSLTINTDQSGFLNATTYRMVFDVAPVVEMIEDIDLQVAVVRDLSGNPTTVDAPDFFGIFLDEDVSTEELPAAFRGLRLFPNPVSSASELQVMMNQAPADLQIRLIDMKGQVLRTIRNADSTIAIPLAGIPAGTYLLQLFSNEGQYAVKFMVE